MSQPEPPSHFASQEATSVGETNPNFLVRIDRSKRREVHAGSAHIRGNTDRSDGDVAHARVFHLARNDLREHTLDLGFDASLSLSLCHLATAASWRLRLSSSTRSG